MSSEVVSRNIAGNNHHWHAIQSGIGYAGGGVGQAGTKMGQQNAWFAGSAGVTIGHMRRYLLVAGDNKANLTFVERINKSNIGMPTKTKNYFNTKFFQIIR